MAEKMMAKRRTIEDEERRMLPLLLLLDELTMGRCSYTSVFSTSASTFMALPPMVDCSSNEATCTTYRGGGVVLGGACSLESDATAATGNGALAAIAAEPVSCVHRYNISEVHF